MASIARTWIGNGIGTELTRVLSLHSISDDSDSNHARGQTAVPDASLIGFDTRPNQEASRSCGSPCHGQ